MAGGCTVLPLRCLGLGPLLLGLYGLTSLSIIGTRPLPLHGTCLQLTNVVGRVVRVTYVSCRPVG